MKMAKKMKTQPLAHSKSCIFTKHERVRLKRVKKMVHLCRVLKVKRILNTATKVIKQECYCFLGIIKYKIVENTFIINK